MPQQGPPWVDIDGALTGHVSHNLRAHQSSCLHQDAAGTTSGKEKLRQLARGLSLSTLTSGIPLFSLKSTKSGADGFTPSLESLWQFWQVPSRYT